jgi:hypothetical protein
MDLVVGYGGTRRGTSGRHATTQLRPAGRRFSLTPPVRSTGSVWEYLIEHERVRN